MNVRAATAQDAAGIVGLHRSANPYGDWFRDPLLKLGRAPYEDLTPMERYFHGGFWMDLSLFRRHLHECQTRGFPVIVAEDAGRIVGECEVWLGEEPPPFGRFAEIAMLKSGLPPKPAVERDLVVRASEWVRRLGFHALDISPLHGGSDHVLDLGFKPLWDTRTFDGALKDVPKPKGEFTATYIAGDYRELGPLQALNHREPARWRFETITSLWPAARFAGLQDATKVAGMAVEAQTQRFAVLAARREWMDPSLAELDLWVDPAKIGVTSSLREAFTVGVEIARRLGTKTVRTYAPPHASKTLHELGFSGGDTPDPWQRWSL